MHRMLGNYEYTAYLWPLLLSIIFLSVMSLYSWHRRRVPGAIPYTVVCLSCAMFMVGVAFEVSAVSMPVKVFWYTFRRALILVPITAMLCFAIQYAGLGRRLLTRRVLVALAIPPLLLMLSAFTNDAHHLQWTGFISGDRVQAMPGPIEWVLMTYGYLLSIVVIGILVWLFIHSSPHRLPVALIVCGLVVTRIAFAVDMAGLNPIPRLDLISVSMVFTAGVYATALFGFRMFDPVRAAHRLVIEQMREGILVLDPQGRIASLNPAAERIFGLPAGQVKGRLIRELLPIYADGLLTDLSETEIEIELKSGQAIRYCTVEVSQLRDWRRLETGRLLVLRDVTGQKRTHAQLIEQQRALAMQNERERLARELHDCLGQALAATHLQASTAKLLFARGNAAQMSECLDVLAETALQAEADMREYLLGINTAVSADRTLFVTLREFLGRYSRQYKLPIELCVLQDLEEQGIPETVAIQLLRTIQEALSNVRKHARATSARITFTVTGDLLQISICDNGQGFDPAAITAKLNGGFGLRSMRERAEELGGCIDFISCPGQGTQVIVKVPLNGDRQVGLQIPTRFVRAVNESSASR